MSWSGEQRSHIHSPLSLRHPGWGVLLFLGPQPPPLLAPHFLACWAEEVGLPAVGAASGCPMSLPRSLTLRQRSIFARI